MKNYQQTIRILLHVLRWKAARLIRTNEYRYEH